MFLNEVAPEEYVRDGGGFIFKVKEVTTNDEGIVFITHHDGEVFEEEVEGYGKKLIDIIYVDDYVNHERVVHIEYREGETVLILSNGDEVRDVEIQNVFTKERFDNWVVHIRGGTI